MSNILKAERKPLSNLVPFGLCVPPPRGGGVYFKSLTWEMLEERQNI